MGKKCEICGKPSGMYPLCPACFKLRDEGKIAKCETCGAWYRTETGCPNCMPKQKDKTITPSPDQTGIITIDSNNKSRCITCGRKTEGLLFCTQCYRKYKDKELLFKITNCTNVELLDEDYEGKRTCKDGHIVKSKSEREIDNYLFEKGIPHAYEKELSYGPNDTDVIRPDFFLPDYLGPNEGVYIEHWGYNENNIKYTKSKEFKMKIYEELKITLICIYEKTDMDKIDSVLDRRLNRDNITPHTINPKIE